MVIKPFKGKARKVTILIFEVLDAESPLNPYKIHQRAEYLCKKRRLKAPYPKTVSERADNLAGWGYLNVADAKRRKGGQEVRYYELTAKIRLAKWLDEISTLIVDLERFVESVTEAEATSVLRALKKEGSASKAHN